MNSFLSDCRFVVKMLRATVRDEDDEPLGLWGKLEVAWQIICRTITIEHTAKRK